jgi:hypothetical protein
MENDSIRTSGGNTLVDIWIEGKMRGICVSKEAIGAYLGFDRAAGMSGDARCEFVRTHLPIVVNAAKARLVDTDPDADIVIIEGGQLPRRDGKSGDRRKSDRRKTERRKVALPKGDRPERRRGNRRQGQRRAEPNPTES